MPKEGCYFIIEMTLTLTKYLQLIIYTQTLPQLRKPPTQPYSKVQAETLFQVPKSCVKSWSNFRSWRRCRYTSCTLTSFTGRSGSIDDPTHILLLRVMWRTIAGNAESRWWWTSCRSLVCLSSSSEWEQSIPEQTTSYEASCNQEIGYLKCRQMVTYLGFYHYTKPECKKEN